MKMKRAGITRRGLAVVVLGSLLLGAFAATPADAKKKKKKKPKPAVCAPYVPGEAGTGADTTVVTDAQTESSPATLTIVTEPGVGFTNTGDPSGDMGVVPHAYTNIQVDTNAKQKGLFIVATFAPAFDYDLFLRTSSGTAVAYEADFNQNPGLGTSSGGHAEMGASYIDGYLALDCAGFTLDVATSSGAGGDVELSYWLA
ncbi:MAG: hypothetical protein ACRDH6_09680 [Actinomycetota bacterium]